MELVLDLQVSPYLNLPLRNNNVPAIRQLTISNQSYESVSNLTVTLQADPTEVLKEGKSWKGLSLEPGDITKLDVDKIPLDYTFFAQLTEGLPGTFTARAYIGEEGETLAEANASTRLLPSAHWGGLLAAPELLAAHILPNDKAVASILRRASQLLLEKKKGYSLNGYQAEDPQKVAAQALAIFTAIAELGIHYSNPPSSFENTGQKVRTPTQIVGEGLGTCLDLTCLVAAALEQAGLHSIVVMVKGHSYIALWLEESPVSHGLIEDAQILRKLIDTWQIMGCETTLLVGASPEVAQAILKGEASIKRGGDFLFAIDVNAARVGEGIHPLGQLVEALEPKDKNERGSAKLDLSALDSIVPKYGETRKTQKPVLKGNARVDNWKKELLDLSRRNALLNWKERKSNLVLHHVDANRLENKLASGAKLHFTAVDKDRAQAGSLGRVLPPDHYAPAIANALENDTLLVVDNDKNLLSTLINLERGSRKSLEEGGASTLYLALGFAEKRAAGQTLEDKPEYRSPLILLPVELKRLRAGNSFTLFLRDDDAILNPTLLELLRREADLSFEDMAAELPTDESGIDVPLILANVRGKLLNVTGWEVRDTVALGEFSFSKYLMWRDLEHKTESLRSNPVVAHLIDTPREPYHLPGSHDEVAFPQHDTLDQTFPVTEMLTPMSADSSQLAAVRAAALGIDFVLEGPPGTGKSQTITNMIAQCLGEGKTVLFVSEKTAALQVVERRLNNIGLGKYCLELHSNKATKTAVYDQLKAASSAEVDSESEYYKEGVKLGQLLAQLNKQVEVLHNPTLSGLSVYDAIAYAARYRDEPAPHPPQEWVLNTTQEQLEEARQQVRNLAIYTQDVSEEGRVLLPLFTDPELKDQQLEANCQKAERAGEKLIAALRSLVAALDIAPENHRKETLANLALFADLIVRAWGKDYTAMAAALTSGRARKEAEADVANTLAIANALLQLENQYKPTVVELDAGALSQKWENSASTFVLFRMITQWFMLRKLQSYTEGSSKPEDTANELQLLSQVEYGLKERNPNAPTLQLNKSYMQNVAQDAQWFSEWAELGTSSAAERWGLSASLVSGLINSLAEEDEKAKNIMKECKSFLKSFIAATGAETAIATIISKHKKGFPQLAENDDYPQALTSLAKALLAAKPDWRAARLYASQAHKVAELGLSWYLENFGTVANPDEGEHKLELGFRRSLAKAVIGSASALNDFSGRRYEDLISQFQQLDKQFAKVAALEVQKRLKERQDTRYRQEFREAHRVLNTEIAKKRKQLPVRQLMKKAGPLISEIMPCMLMSPLSIAQYLPPDETFQFDVVIFDEASQIPVWDAIGAIARGKQVIVVGDSKQLPPTNFFKAVDDSEQEEDVVEDLESILDEMKAAQLQTRRLRWHYRSRAESLIAFSNRTYYDNELNTFPAPVAYDGAVQFHKVESNSYNKGTNPVEAQALVDYLVNRLRRSAPNEITYGVVTFSQSQQAIIEDKLEEARAKHPEIDPYFNPEFDERLFVKNIENVQGDERDVILFSVGYGPDKDNYFRMSFGPMNQIGGERRLNVAVTRSRVEMHVFSSITHNQIDASKLGANAQGARDLQSFLQYAEKGSSMWQEAQGSNKKKQKYPLEEAIADLLQQRGWETELRVGVSGYKVDIAVKHPQQEGSYLAGIEIDNTEYFKTATARERNVLRESVMEGLGWNMIKVWALDWWHQPERIADAIAEELTSLTKSTSDKEVEQAELTHALAEQDTLEELAPSHLTREVHQENSAPPAPTQKAEVQVANEYQYTQPGQLLTFLKRAEADTKNAAEPLLDRRSRPATTAMLHAVVEREAPIIVSEAIKRVATQGYGVARINKSVKQEIEQVLRVCCFVTKQGGEEVVYLTEKDSYRNISYRPPQPDAPDKRGIADIPLIELKALAYELLPQYTDGDDVLREMGVRIGISRVAGSSRERAKRALDWAWDR